MSNAYRDKLLSVGVISRRSRPTVTEGRHHPETGRAWKRTEDDGSIITEHDTRDDRVDATAKVDTIRVSHAELVERREAATRDREET